MLKTLRVLKRTGLLYSIGIVINRIVPLWLMRFRVFNVYEIDSAKFHSPAPSQSPSQSTQIEPEISLVETQSDLERVRSLTFFDDCSMDADLKAVQAVVDNQLAGAVWVARRRFEESELGICVELDPTQAWIFAALVDKRFRQRGIYRRVLAFMSSHLQTSGVDAQLLCINPLNKASMNAHRKYFKAQLGQIYALRLLGVAICVRRGNSLTIDRSITWNCKKEPLRLRCKSA